MNKSRKNKSCFGCLVSFIFFLLLLVAVGLGGWLYLPHLAQIPLGATVAIVSPRPDSPALLKQPLAVQIRAEGPQSWQRLELYANGLLILTQDSPAENPLQITTSFTPLVPGRVIFQARAYDQLGQFTDSAVVFVHVAGEGDEVVIPARNSGLQVTIVDCDAAQLNWSPFPNATGYVVYRLGPGDGYFERVTQLPAGTTAYRESIPSLAIYRYQLAALVNGQETLSPLMTASPPDPCLAQPQTQTMKLAGLQTNEVYDGVYCYVAVNGGAYQRVPAGDFTLFTPNADGRTYQLSNYLVVGGLQAFDLAGECWGRRGNEAILLGPFATTVDPKSQTGNVPAGLPFQLFYHFEPESDLSAPHIVQTKPNDPMALPPATNLRIQPSLTGCIQFESQQAQNQCLLGGLGTAGWPTLLWDWLANPTYDEADLTRYQVNLIINGQERQLLANITRLGLQPLRRSLILPNTYLPCNSTLEVEVQAIGGALAAVPAGISWQTTAPCP